MAIPPEKAAAALPKRTPGGIPYPKVAEAADELLREAQSTGKSGPAAEPLFAAVCQRLRDRGIPFGQNQAHTHFKQWQAERPQPALPALELSPTFVRASQQEIALAVAARTEALRHRLETSEAEARALAQSGALLEDKQIELQEAITILNTERDQLTALNTRQATELDGLTKELTEQRRNAELSRIEAAEARQTAERYQEQLTRYPAEIETLQATVQTETTDRIAAQRRQAVLEETCRKLEEQLTEVRQREEKQVNDLRQREDAAVAENKALHARVEALLEELRAGDAKFGRADGERTLAERTLQEASAQLKEARAQVTDLAERAGAAAAAQEGWARAQRDLGVSQEHLARSRTEQERLATENTQLRAAQGEA
jgi:chromosome segregation ATPase